MLTACLGRTPEPTVVTQTEYVSQNIPTQERPKKVEFPPVEWYVVTEENLDQKIEELKTSTGNVVFFAISAKGYENLAIGIGDLRRYIKEQQAIIGYYEDALNE
jgi:hypothetical protein